MKAAPPGPGHLPVLLLALTPTSACTSPGSATLGPRADYAPVAEALARFVETERGDKGIPAISIALVDDREIVWAAGFGWSDREETVPADAETIYRVGAVSELITAMAVIQLAESGALDLDAPLTEALPGFSTRTPHETPLTLRQLLAHRAGLVREPPVGASFDPEEAELAAIVASLAETSAVYAPASQKKHSNAAVTVAGHALERTVERPFEDHVRASLLEPAGMRSSAFRREAWMDGRVAAGSLWTYDGRTLPAPDFETGTLPATNLYAPVTDLARLLELLFARGETTGGRVLEAASLEEMWAPRFDPPERRVRLGLGFDVRRLDELTCVGRDGSLHGFATSLRALPDVRLGVVVASSLDGTQAVTGHIAELALRSMLAARTGAPLPQPESTSPVPPAVAETLLGTWTRDGTLLEVVRAAGELYATSSQGGVRTRIRTLEGELVIDGRLSFGQRIEPTKRGLALDGELYTRLDPGKPAPCPPGWRGLVGEYGCEREVLLVFEERGRLYALLEWFYRYPLEEVAPGRFRLPDTGRYRGEEIVFERDAYGRATLAVLGGVALERRAVGPEDGADFEIEPLEDREALEAAAAAARPPAEGVKRQPDLLDLRELDEGIRFDVRYASERNFMGMAFYAAPKAYLQRPAAEALERAHRRLAGAGYGLLVFDALRPWRVTKMFWDATPEPLRDFVADPARGSRHNRGCAVDLTLYELATGRPADMVSGYDEFSPRASPYYPGETSLERWHRDLLRSVMQAEGFEPYPNEWWHFDFRDWREYPLLEEFPDEP